MSGLRFRIVSAYVLLIVLAFAALGLFVLSRVEDAVRDSKNDDLAAQARMVANIIQPQTSTSSSGSIDALAKQMGANTGTRVTIIDAQGRVLGDSEADPQTMENHSDRPEVQQALASGEGRSARRSATVDENLTYVAVRANLAGGPIIVRLARPTATIDSAVSDVETSLLIAIVLAGVLAVLLGVIVSRSLLRPLGWISEAASTIAGGDYSARVNPRPSGEIGLVADAFNTMAETVQEQIVAASQERGRLAAALNSSVDAVAALDREGRVVFGNVALEQLFARKEQEVVGNPFVWLLPDERVMEAFRASRDLGGRRETLIERPGKRYHQVVTTPISNGGEWAVLIVFHDQTDVKRTDQVRRDFVANVSHELRTPLAALKSVVETLRDGAVNDPKVADEFLTRADQEVDRLVQMVEELLELSRIESGEIPLALEPVDIAALLSGAVERLRPQAERRNLKLTVQADGAGEAKLDVKRVELAVTNLVHNAIKFTPEGGSVIVSAERTPQRLVIKVSDTGSGIDAADLPRIFERFYKVDQSRASGGSGLGLALVRHAVEAHGGSVTAESRLGEGSSFTITLPLAE